MIEEHWEHKAGEPSPHKLPIFCNEKLMYLDGFLSTKDIFQPIEKGNPYLQSNQMEYIRVIIRDRFIAKVVMTVWR